ncbi:peptide deformylase [Occultella glacieicola]|uniref:Peptide deformylase n=1 Tax=Occultella glacieicola TaxID=2518684 RepID=A0ABY2DXW2_9MICO|nr:peptide deformylase [Occultella glacieicola]TDE88513.1 peptide deformylase [Occultella glacieicola]
MGHETAGPLAARVRELLDHAQDGVVPIVRAGEPVLRRRAPAYRGELDAGLLNDLIASMFATMRAAPGVGLAAPQIGLPLALAVIEDPGAADPDVAQTRERYPVAPMVLVNPRYEPVDTDVAEFYEGCLSIPGWVAVRRRRRTVRLRAETLDGTSTVATTSGWLARIVQHETDHLAGELFLDRAEPRSLAHESLAARWAGPADPTLAAEALGFDLSGP